MNDDTQPPLTTRARSWPEVEQFYLDLGTSPQWRVGIVLELIRELRLQPWSRVIHPLTSHETLCLARRPIFTWGEDMLQVGVDEGALVVSHLSQPSKGTSTVAPLESGLSAKEALAVIQSWASKG